MLMHLGIAEGFDLSKTIDNPVKILPEATISYYKYLGYSDNDWTTKEAQHKKTELS